MAEKSQQDLIDGINALIDGRLKGINVPKTIVGTVVQDPSGFDCIVKIYGTEKNTILPEHLHDWVSKDDIVIVQDTKGDGSEMVVIGSSGSTRDNSLVIEDTEQRHYISGVTKLEDSGIEKLSDEHIKID